jgi:hypothetical protein
MTKVTCLPDRHQSETWRGDPMNRRLMVRVDLVLAADEVGVVGVP